MAQYINAEKLKAKINEVRQDWLGDSTGLEVAEEGAALGAAESILDSIDDIIDSLQQEQPEVDLDKEIKKIWDKCIPEDEGMGVEIANIHIESFDIIARHFYELGLKAGKEE